MAVLRSTVLIKAPSATVGGALRHTRTAERDLVRLGVRGQVATPAVELLVPGDEMSFRLGPCSALSVRTRVVDADAARLSSVLVAGVLRELSHESVLAEVGGYTLLTDTVRWRSPFPFLGRIADVLLVRRLVLSVLDHRLTAIRELAESWARRPVVVGTAIVRDGRVLAQQRGYPAQDAGRWELPGGRVESGETERDAVIRECKEELDVVVTPTGRVGTDVPLDNGMVLRVHTAALADPSAVPKALEHRAVRWVDRDEIARLDWLDADRVLAHSLRGLLG